MQLTGPRSPPARVLDWMRAWDGAVRGLLAERPDGTPHTPRPFSPIGVAVAAAMFAALAAVVAKVGSHPFLLVMFICFATLYAALVPLPLLLRPLGFGRRRREEQAGLDAAAALALQSWQETASRAVAAWHVAREAALRALDPLVLADSEARAAAEVVRRLVPPPAPVPGVPVGVLHDAAAQPLSTLPSLEGWSGVTEDVVYLARRKPFTLSEVLVVLAGATTVPPAIFLAIDGAASAVTCAVLPGACPQPDAGRNLFVLGMVALTGVVLLWRAVSRARLECPACGSLVTIPRLAPHGRCPGCRRRVWVQWRR